MNIIGPHAKLHGRSLARLALIAAAILMASATTISFASTAFADQYDKRIKALQNEINQYQAQAQSLQGQASCLQDELNRLASDKAIIQGQIDIIQVRYDQLQQQIKETTKKIKDNQDALGETLANLYVDDDISPLEMLASSNNISEYLDRQEYRNSIRDTLTQTIATIKVLESQLNKQKADVERTLTESKNARKALANKEAERQTLLDQTNGQEAAYQKLSKDKQSEAERLRTEQAAANTRAAQRGNSQTIIGNTAGGGNYPSAWANAPMDTIVDDWALYNRECVSYVAWKIASTGRFVPRFNGQGNANQWESYVAQYGITSGTTPVVGSAAVLYGGAYGHVMYVESVSDDKSRITVSEYNYELTGLYSKRSISSTGLKYLYF